MKKIIIFFGLGLLISCVNGEDQSDVTSSGNNINSKVVSGELLGRKHRIENNMQIYTGSLKVYKEKSMTGMQKKIPPSLYNDYALQISILQSSQKYDEMYKIFEDIKKLKTEIIVDLTQESKKYTKRDLEDIMKLEKDFFDK